MSAPPLGSPATGADAPPWRLARLLRATFGRVLLALFRVRVRGLERLPQNGGYVLAGNHVSYLDPALLWCLAPHETHFIAKRELFDTPILAWALPRVWAFPITRGTPDREAITRATALLMRGEPVGMFPEGTRASSDDLTPEGLGEAHEGVAFIATRAGAPVVPVGIAGTDRALPRGARLPRLARVTVCFGEPVYPSMFAEGGRKERTAAMTAEIMSRIALARDFAEEE